MNQPYEIPRQESCRDHKIYEQLPGALRSHYRRWDTITRICTGCGDRLRPIENQNGHAFCYSCRQALFPETISQRKSFDKKVRSSGRFR